MEKLNRKYSKKNIPIPSKEEYQVHLLSKVEKFIKRTRWKPLRLKHEQSKTKTFEYDLMLTIENSVF